ncbi:unnamed protein product [marine sediment metagenome]|uniref:Uncharacterized protein n=1 Tax=marine sediment metagenome TaxID=412755 RepID=X1LU74_9ZZZZ
MNENEKQELENIDWSKPYVYDEWWKSLNVNQKASAYWCENCK